MKQFYLSVYENSATKSKWQRRIGKRIGKKCWKLEWNLNSQGLSSNVHTFGTPIRGYPEGKLDAFSTSEKCSGSEKHAETRFIIIKKYKLSNNLIQIAHIANTPSNSALFTCSRSLIGLALNAQVHDVVTADGTVIHHNIWNIDNKPFLYLYISN